MEEIIANSFSHCGFVNQEDVERLETREEAFDDIWSRLRTANLVPDDVAIDDYTSLDSNLVTSCNLDEFNVEQCGESMVEVLSSYGENESIVPIEPTYKECFQVLSIIPRKIQMNGLQCDMELNMVEEMIMKNQENNMDETNITDFFN